MAEPKKTLYHSELVKAGECTLDVGKTIASTHKKGTFITFVKFGGHNRTYQCETGEIADKLKKREGQRCTVLAGGVKGQVGTLKIVHAEWAPASGEAQEAGPEAPDDDAPPPSRGQAPAKRAPEPEPADDAPAAPDRPAAQAAPKASPSAALNAALFRMVNVQMKIQVFLSQMYAELESKRGIRLSPEEKSGLAGQLFIQVNKEFLAGHGSVPTDHLIDITPKQKPAPAPPSPDDDGREPEGGAQ